MHRHTRAVVAASAFAIITRDKTAGLYDHAADRHLRIAAECRGDRLQGYDGDRSVSFGGTLPDLYDAGDRSFTSYEIDGSTVRGFDRSAAHFFEARSSGQRVDVYDHGEAAWFAYTVQSVAGSQEPSEP